MTANLKSCMRPERKTSGLYSSPSSGLTRERYLEENRVIGGIVEGGRVEDGREARTREYKRRDLCESLND